MSGPAIFSGTTYQSRVIAHIEIHILAQARLGWLAPHDDTPVAISAETGGPGDDVEVEFGEHHPPAEVQAKHGLTGGAKLSEAIRDIRDRSKDHASTHVILVVDRSSSRTVHGHFAHDLQRIRSGRQDGLKSDAKRLIEELGDDATLLQRLYVVTLDLDNEHDPETKLSFQMLESVLEDRQQATAAWAVLVNDAMIVSANRLRRSRNYLVDLLAGAKIKVRLPTKDERLMQQLDLTKRLLASGRAEAVLTILDAIGAETADGVDPKVRYRAFQHRAAALLDLDRPGEALRVAQQALDIDGSGVHALLNAAHAAVRIGDVASAIRYADRAVEAASDDPDAWTVRVQIAALAGEPLPSPRTSVVEAPSYQIALAQIAANAGEWDQVLQLTGAILAKGVRAPRMLTLRIAALLTVDWKDEPSARENWAEAERLATDALEACERESRLRTDLLVQRAEARHRLGKTAESSADLELAHEMDEDHPDAIGRLAQAHLNSGRTAEALEVLRSRVANEYPMLLVLRAQALATSGDVEGARHDLDRAIGRLEEAPEPDTLRLLSADVALAIGDTTWAARILEAMSSDSVAPEMQATLRGRIALAQGDIDGGITWFRKAAERAPTPEARTQIVGELGGRLLRIDRPREAVQALENLAPSTMPESLKHDFAAALMLTNEFARAATVVEAVADAGPVPDWALGIASDLAIRQGDTDRALETLRKLHDRHPGDHRIVLELARRFIEANDVDGAQPYLDKLLEAGDAPPAMKMDIAHLLKAVGRVEEGLPLALRAFRMRRDDPAMHRGFVGFLIDSPPVLSEPLEVTAQTCVRMTSDDGLEREYVIYADEPIDRLQKEISIEDAAKTGYLGKRRGEVIKEHLGGWERQWTVAEILPAAVHVFRDIITHYEARFPGEPFFFTMFKMPEEMSVRTFAPLISTLQSRRSRAEHVFQIYREHGLPLGWIAKMLDISVAEAMAATISSDDPGRPLLVEWGDAESQEKSRNAARSAMSVVITRSALETLLDLDLLDSLPNVYEWLTPRALVTTLKRESAEAEAKIESGHQVMFSGATGLELAEIPAGHPVLVNRAERIRSILQWVEANARVELRPLETIPAEGSREEQAREMIGSDSDDAVQLAQHFGVSLLADDFGLRKYLGLDARGKSFSTVTLLPVLAERGVISADQRDELLLRLVDRKYVVVAPTKALLNTSIRVANGRIGEVARAFALLAGPVLDLAPAARMAAEVLKAQSVTDVQLFGLETLVTMSLEALAARWPANICVYSLTRAAAEEFALLPQHLAAIRKTAAAFLRTRS